LMLADGAGPIVVSESIGPLTASSRDDVQHRCRTNVVE
jgi:hypothetical protein